MKVRGYSLALAQALLAAAAACGPVLADDGRAVSAAYELRMILGLYVPPALGQDGGLEPVIEHSADLTVPAFSRIVIEPRGASRLEGLGTPGSKVVLNSSGRVIGSAIVEDTGRWLVTLNEGLPPGEHRIQSGVSSNGNGKVLYGDEVRIAVPQDLKGAAVVAYEAPAGVTVRQRAEDLARKATEVFNGIVPQNRPPAQPNPGQTPQHKFTDKLAQGAPPADDPPSGQTPSSQQAPSGVTGAVFDWLRRSAREYNGVIIRDLSVPTPGPPPSPSEETAEGTPVPVAPVPREQPPSSTAASDAARQLVDERRKAEEDYRLKQQAEAKRKAEDAKRLEAERLRKAAEAKKAADEFARKKAESDVRIQEGLRQLEATKKETNAKTAAEAKRMAEEAARKDAARKAAEAQAKKDAVEKRLADQKQSKAGVAPDRASEDKPAPLGVKPQPETFEDAVAEEQRKAIQSEEGAQALEDDADLIEPSEETPRASKRSYQSRKLARKKSASRTHGWRRHQAATGCRSGRTYWRRHKRYYVVGPADTLWSIARRYCGGGARYNWIFEANRRVLSDPDIVRSCMRLRIPTRCSSQRR